MKDNMLTHISDAKKREILENSKTIVIVGLSPDPSKASYRVASFLLEKGYDIIPIYPKSISILEKKSHRSLKEAFIYMESKEKKCDIINIFRKSEALPDVLKEICSLKGLKSFNERQICVWVQLGLQNIKAAEIAMQNDLIYEENSCIKIEYNKLFF